MAATPIRLTTDQELPKEVMNWGMNDVANWLYSIEFEQYQPQFQRNRIGGLELIDIDAEQLDLLGVKPLGHKKRILSAINRLVYGDTETSLPEPASPQRSRYLAAPASSQNRSLVSASWSSGISWNNIRSPSNSNNSLEISSS